MRKMRREKSNIICALIAAVLALGLFYAYHYVQSVMSGAKEHVKVGFIYDGDASTPYSANFIRAAGRLRTELGKKVDIIEKNNVPYDNADEIIDELVKEGCDIVFTNSYGYGEAAKKAAEKYSDVEFCEATCDNANDEPRLENYHTFMGEIYQGRYICGMAAGAKLNEMIENGVITRQQAVVGFAVIRIRLLFADLPDQCRHPDLGICGCAVSFVHQLVTDIYGRFDLCIHFFQKLAAAGAFYSVIIDLGTAAGQRVFDSVRFLFNTQHDAAFPVQHDAVYLPDCHFRRYSFRDPVDFCHAYFFSLTRADPAIQPGCCLSAQ